MWLWVFFCRNCCCFCCWCPWPFWANLEAISLFYCYYVDSWKSLLSYQFDSLKLLLTYQFLFKNNQYLTKFVMIGLFLTSLKTALNFEWAFKVCIKYIFCYLTNKNCNDAYFESEIKTFFQSQKNVSLLTGAPQLHWNMQDGLGQWSTYRVFSYCEGNYAEIQVCRFCLAFKTFSGNHSVTAWKVTPFLIKAYLQNF